MFQRRLSVHDVCQIGAGRAGLSRPSHEPFGHFFAESWSFPGDETVVKVQGGSYRTIGVTDLVEMLKTKDFFLVNVHIPYMGEIPRTDAFIGYEETKARLDDYPRNKQAKIVVYCLTNHMSGIAARELVLAGYTKVYLVDGGMTAWRKARFVLLKKATAE